MSIIAQNITKTFGAYTALEGVNLNVPAGKLVALLGPSGSGKTTLLRIIAGLEFADQGSGRIEFHGEDVTATPAGKRGVGFVFQHYALFRHMTVAQNIAFGLTVRRRKERPPQKVIDARVQELLKLIQLENLGSRFPKQLSGGQRQRVALARALAVQPKVLLLDEPFGALDARVRKDLRRWLRQFQREIGITTIFVTHDQEEALELADEVVVMNNAKIEQVGTPQEVYDRPSTPFVIEFLGNVNRFSGLSHPLPGAGNDVLYVRPHDVDIKRDYSGEHGIRVRVQHVFSAGNYGRIALVRADTDDTIDAELSRVRLAELNLKVGDEVWVVFRHIRLFPSGAFSERDVITEDAAPATLDVGQGI
ncbi:MAG TPA: sulfate/molybdate ABC transporter ATP-binding protein [Rariglobus sp.]|jgi:sulfate transport system ATP-binding protein|nr:sulfate/molybdate ABC transporter ATP-binding protein [Rariglobus sp.]